jgi:hypothetical protein
MSKVIKAEILTGTKFNSLTVVHEVDSKYSASGNRKRYFLFHCDCGVEKVILLYSVRSGATKSCGCLNIKQIREESRKQTKHNLRSHDLYKRWQKIKGRCLRHSDRRYKDYGGRGITICNEWIDDFMSFYNWALANGYQPHLEIDRIDNNDGYRPDNCRFVTTKDNANNTRRNIHVEYQGKSMTLKQACEAADIVSHYRTIWQRVKGGKSFEESIKQYLCQG